MHVNLRDALGKLDEELTALPGLERTDVPDLQAAQTLRPCALVAHCMVYEIGPGRDDMNPMRLERGIRATELGPLFFTRRGETDPAISNHPSDRPPAKGGLRWLVDLEDHRPMVHRADTSGRTEVA